MERWDCFMYLYKLYNVYLSTTTSNGLYDTLFTARTMKSATISGLTRKLL